MSTFSSFSPVRASERTLVLISFAILATLGMISCAWFGDHSRLAMVTFNEAYATEGLRLDDCAVCHSSGRSLNAYGKAVRAAIPDGAEGTADDVDQLLRAFAATEDVDSDGDGFTNAFEIRSQSPTRGLSFLGNGRALGSD